MKENEGGKGRKKKITGKDEIRYRRQKMFLTWKKRKGKRDGNKKKNKKNKKKRMLRFCPKNSKSIKCTFGLCIFPSQVIQFGLQKICMTTVFRYSKLMLEAYGVHHYLSMYNLFPPDSVVLPHKHHWTYQSLNVLFQLKSAHLLWYTSP